MIRFGRLNLALALVLLLPAVASAQKDSKFTKEASKYLGLAMAKQNPAERAQLYQTALTHLRQGQTEDAQNAKVWLLSGTVLAALGELKEADAAFLKAQELHPAYAEEIEGEREAAWIEAFNAGIAKMDAKDFAGAIETLEGAQQIYSKRPEGLMNLGALYANNNQRDKAVEAFRTAIEVSKGPLFEKLDEAGKASWMRYRDMATLNLAQMAAASGVDAFSEKNYVKAAADFKQAAELNPHARDYWFNLMQAYWAQASDLDDKIPTLPAGEQAAAKANASKLYEDVLTYAKKTRELDPYSETLYIIEARAEKQLGEYSGNAERQKQGGEKALKVLEALQELGVDLSEIAVAGEAEGATITGKFKTLMRADNSRKLAAGAPVTVSFTLLGLDGKPVGQQDVTITMVEGEEAQSFEAKVATVTGEIAGWKYSVK